jgi:hypothetical protein
MTPFFSFCTILKVLKSKDLENLVHELLQHI